MSQGRLFAIKSAVFEIKSYNCFSLLSFYHTGQKSFLYIKSSQTCPDFNLSWVNNRKQHLFKNVRNKEFSHV